MSNPCPNCNDSGYDPEFDVVPRCCNRPDENGDCCGHPEPEQVPLPCRLCCIPAAPSTPA